MQKAATGEGAEWAARVTEEKIGKGKVMGVGERTEGVEMEVWRRINGSEKLHCYGFLKLNMEGAEPFFQ